MHNISKPDCTATMTDATQLTLEKGYRPQPNDILSGRSKYSYNHGMLFLINKSPYVTFSC